MTEARTSARLADGLTVQTSNQFPEPAFAETPDPAERSLIEDLRMLAGDARTLAEAELAYQKSRAGVLGGGLGKIAGLGAVAVILAVLALVALVVGLVFALTPILTAWGATAVVTVGLLLLALGAALWARSSWTALTALLHESTAP
jgi:uncharacterized membrane protein YqjE